MLHVCDVEFKISTTFEGPELLYPPAKKTSSFEEVAASQ
jgi:hypothetical protein